MIWLFVVLSGVICFVVAAVAVGSVTANQATKARPVVYDLNRAVDFVADALGAEASASLSYDDVRQLLLWHLDYLQTKGVASYRTDADVNPSLVVVTDDEPLAYLIGRADDGDLEVSDEHIVEVLAAEQNYSRNIGAFGPQVR